MYLGNGGGRGRKKGLRARDGGRGGGWRRKKRGNLGKQKNRKSEKSEKFGAVAPEIRGCGGSLGARNHQCSFLYRFGPKRRDPEGFPGRKCVFYAKSAFWGC